MTNPSAFLRTYTNPASADVAATVASEVLSEKLGARVIVTYEEVAPYEYMLTLPESLELVPATGMVHDMPLKQKPFAPAEHSMLLVCDEDGRVSEPTTYPLTHTGLES